MKHSDQKIYLASKSARRRELLRQIGVEFELLLLRDQTPRGPEVTEAVLPNETAEVYVARVTREKAACAHHTMLWRKLPNRPILAADTTVVVDGQILGKPNGYNAAVEMLRLLSGRSHEVFTSIVVHQHDEIWQVTQRSQVRFTTLSEAEIHTYCMSSEPFDKAGGYAIQGMAAVFIEEITGSYSGIMGLPLFETTRLLRQAGIPILGTHSCVT